MTQSSGDVGAQRSRRARQRDANANSGIDIASHAHIESLFSARGVDERRGSDPDDSR